MKKIASILTIFMLIMSIQGFGQIRKADRKYTLYHFARAIPYYQKALKSSDPLIHLRALNRLGDCYRLTNEIEKAVSHYSLAAENPQADPIVWLHLGETLQRIGEYEKAKSAFEKYASLAPADSKGTLFASTVMIHKAWKDLEGGWEIKNSDNLNSPWSEFSPAPYMNGILFASDRGTDLLNKMSFGWTGTSYLKLYGSEPLIYKDFWRGFGEPTLLGGSLNQYYHNGPAFVTSDNSRIYITRTLWTKDKKGKDRIVTRLLKIYSGDLKGGSGPEPFAHNSNEYSVAHPALTKDGKTMVFSSDMPGGKGGMDLYFSRFENGAWSKPQNLGDQINTIGNEAFPFLLNDTILYFASSGLPGYGGLDIFRSILDAGMQWGEPVNLKAPLNSSYDDFGICLAQDGQTGLFSSSRPGGKGKDDIYALKVKALPPKEVKPTPVEEPVVIEKPAEKPSMAAQLTGYVKDKQTSLPIEGSKVYVLNTITNKVLVLETDPQGKFAAPIEKGILFMVKAMKDGYIQDCMQFSFPESQEGTSLSAPRDLLLDKLEVNKVFVLENIYYDFDKWNIRPDAAIELNKLVQIMNENPIRIELGSHTDSRGSDPYNQALSQRRAESAVQYIISQGISANRLTAKGYGETKLVNRCANGVPCSDAEHQANRRTEFKIIDIIRQLQARPADLPSFKAGDEVDYRLLPANFFTNCGQP